MSGSNRANGTTKAPSFFTSEETVTVDLDDGFWVELKRELDYGEENELEGAAIRAGVDLGTGPATPSFQYDAGNQRELKLALYLVDWNLTDGAGKTVNLPDQLSKRQALIRRLRPRWARIIDARIEQLRMGEGLSNVVDVSQAEGAEVDPTTPGAASEPETPSSSDDGLAVSATATSSEPPPASSGKRLR